jgi:hypothetical protein
VGLQIQFTAHGGLLLLQLVSSVHPFAPRQDQVDDQLHEPGELAEDVPSIHAYWKELLQDQFTGVGGGMMNVVSHFHCTTSDLPMIRSSITDCSNHPYHAVMRIALILVGTQDAMISIVPSLRITISAAVTPV